MDGNCLFRMFHSFLAFEVIQNSMGLCNNNTGEEHKMTQGKMECMMVVVEMITN
jgi:hypothetical protein